MGWVVKATPRPFCRRETDLLPIVQLDGPQGRSVQVMKASTPPLGMNPRTVHPVASRMLKWIYFNAFCTIWKEAALSLISGASPRFVWVS
jgi:hypothetical protein